MSNNSFGARAPLTVEGRSYDIFRLDTLGRAAEVARLPFSLPLQFQPGSSVTSLGLTGHELFDIVGLQGSEADKFPQEVTVLADGKQFVAHIRIDTPNEVAYFRHGGILPYMLRRLRGQAPDDVGGDRSASA